MASREKAIKELEWFLFTEPLYSDKERYDQFKEGLHEALVLLKEQEPVDTELEGGGTTWWYVCGECHGAIDKRDAYCRHCGRKLRKQ